MKPLSKIQVLLLQKIFQKAITPQWQRENLTLEETINLGNLAYKLGLGVT